MTDPITQQIESTVQSSTRRDDLVGVGLLMWMARAGEIIAPWWSKRRDGQLRDFYHQSDHFSSAMWMIATKLASIPFRVEARDKSVKAHLKLADQYNIILHDLIQFGDGWSEFWHPFFIDLWCQDNGAFGEVIDQEGSDPNGPREGPAIGLAHLDSYRCTRTSNPEYPVRYQDSDGRTYRFHHTRVIYRSQQRSPAAEMNGVGFCWESRAINSVQNLVDIGVYKQEKLGSRPMRSILQGKGISTKQILDAVRMAEEGMTNQGLRRFAKSIVLGSPNPNWDITLLDLASLPDGFDERDSTELGMILVALAGGFPPRWLWPATTVGATKADAYFSHIAGMGGGLSWHLDMMKSLLSVTKTAAGLTRVLPLKFLPPELTIVFDYQDDEQDNLQAEIRKKRADTRKTDLETQVTDLRVSREQALSAGDLTPAQFEYLELEDGRLPNGDSIMTLFSSVDNLFVELLDLGVDDPLAVDFNDPTDMMLEIEGAALEAQDRLVQAGSQGERRKIEQAITALSALKEIYQEIVVQQIQQEAALQEGPPAPGEEEEAPPGETPPPEEEEEEAPEETEEKAFDFGAKVGEVISGQLARGAGGQFVSASELAAQRSELLGQLLSRLRAKRGEGAGRKGAAEVKRTQNREKVGDKVGIGAAKLDTLAAMRKGDDVSPEELAGLPAGTTETLEDGTVVMSKAGRALLNAANSGDVDRAKKALDDAKKPAPGKKPRAGRAPKPTAEQREQERQAQESQNRQAASEESGVDFEALSSFEAGQPLSPEASAQMAQDGLIEFDTDGEARMTSAGRSALRAANKGEAGQVRDALSTGQDRVERVRERATDQQERAQERRDSASELTDEADAAQAEADELSADPRATESQKRRAERLAERAEKLRERAAQENERADELQAKADEILQRIGGTQEEKSKKKSLSDFRLTVRAAIRQLWTGQSSQFDFVNQMVFAINRQFTNAWKEGAAQCGVAMEELTVAEESALRNAINSQFPFLPRFAREIEAESKANGGKLGPLMGRGELWINQYEKIQNQARAMACRDKKLEWRLGAAEHCSSCLKLAGKVKRASWWTENGILPRVPGAGYLECRGYNCQCDLVPVTFNLSPGRMPNLP